MKVRERERCWSPSYKDKVCVCVCVCVRARCDLGRRNPGLPLRQTHSLMRLPQPRVPY